MSFKPKNYTIQEMRDAIKQSTKESNLYFGSDSKVLFTSYGEIVCISTVMVLHKDGSKGCKVLGFTSYHKHNDYNRAKPFNRMIEETYCTIDLVQELLDEIQDRKVEVHLDINKSKEHGSSVAVQAAMGLVQGILQISPKIKPQAFAASAAADWFI